MIAMKRLFTICIAIALLVGSLLMQKIARAADKEPLVSVSQESSTTGAYAGRSGSVSRSGSGAGGENDASGNASSDSEPTPEQMNKRQKIIVY